MSPERLEEVLRESLRREDPGEQFTARVLAQASAPRRGWWHGLLGAYRLRWATAGALALALLAAGAAEYRRAQVRSEGQRAKEQLVLALRITGDKLRVARANVVHLSSAERE